VLIKKKGEMTSQENKDKWHADSNNWKLGILYFNKEDKRIIVPKRIGFLGWTVNFATPIVYVILIGFLCIGYVSITK
jgi:uncharacterized membrane protein